MPAPPPKPITRASFDAWLNEITHSKPEQAPLPIFDPNGIAFWSPNEGFVVLTPPPPKDHSNA